MTPEKISETPAKIVVINDPKRTEASVAVHAAGCQGIKEDVYGGGRPPAEHWEESTTLTPEAYWREYNSDFIAEGGLDAAWDIRFHDCAKRVMGKA